MKIYCFGDSNTCGYDPRSFLGERFPAEDCWVNILSEKFLCSVVNDGENGREIPGKKWEMEALGSFLYKHSPIDLLLVMLGTNDLLQGNSVTEVTERMARFLQQIPLEKEKVLLIGPPQLKRGAWVPDEELVIASQQLNEAYKQLAARLDVRFVDAGQWDLPVAFDGVHLTQQGHRIFADELFNYLKEGE